MGGAERAPELCWGRQCRRRRRCRPRQRLDWSAASPAAPAPAPCLPAAVCMDGTRNRGAVKGAVDEFAAAHNLTLTVTCEEMWPSWMARKP